MVGQIMKTGLLTEYLVTTTKRNNSREIKLIMEKILVLLVIASLLFIAVQVSSYNLY